MSTDPKVQYWNIVSYAASGNWQALYEALAALKPPPYEYEQAWVNPQFFRDLLAEDYQSWTTERDLPFKVLNKLVVQNDRYILLVFLRADGVGFRISRQS